MIEFSTFINNIDVQNVISWFLIIMGAFFVITGAIGIMRFPDFYTRLHPAALINSVGAPSILAGIAVQCGFNNITLKIVLLIGILLVTSAVLTHSLAKTAMLQGLKPCGSLKT